MLVMCRLAGFGQDTATYEVLTSKASLCHLQKRYKEGLAYYEQAFALQQPDDLNAYKAAALYALDSNSVKALAYLHLALEKGWADAGWLAADNYFEYVKSTAPVEWQETLKEAYQVETLYAKRLRLPLLRQQINRLTLNDQQLRYRQIQATSQAMSDSLTRDIARSDAHNLGVAKRIIGQYGWPALSDIGRDGANNLWLIVQHSDQDILFQRRVLTLMEKMKPTGEVDLEDYAYLYDRVRCGLNERQYYGTQVRWSGHGEAVGFRPIREENTVDQRRKALGMSTLTIYALTYGFDYKPVTRQEAIQSEEQDQREVHRLIDSAHQAYRQKRFKAVYDFYNTASDIQGGMDNAANYDAALQCARIGRLTKDQAFIDIAVDFLVLLYKRGAVDTRTLLQEPAFIVLRKEPRWLTILHGEPI
jgi:hypothetical protein